MQDADFPESAPDTAEQSEKLRGDLFGFWHEMSHFITAIGRGHPWWARGQLEALRSVCVNLERLENNFADEGVGNEPYFKIEYAMPVEKLATLQSVQVVVAFYQQMAPSLAERHGIRYPHKLKRVMLQRLEKLLG